MLDQGPLLTGVNLHAALADIRHSVEAGTVGGQRFGFDHAGFHESYAAFMSAWEDVKTEQKPLATSFGMCYAFRIDGVSDATTQAELALNSTTGSALMRLSSLEGELAQFLDDLRSAYVEYLETDDESRLRLVVASSGAQALASNSAPATNTDAR